MTTEAAAALYEAQHVHEHKGLRNAVFNPHGTPTGELPVIYGYNGGKLGAFFLNAALMAADGTELGSHACSSEAYMPADLGILEGTRPDLHETFREHYPDGYRMEFVGCADAPDHSGLNAAIEINRTAAKEGE